MYAADDPRSKLASASPKKATPLAFHDAQRQFYYEDAPQESSELGRVWYSRGQNLVTVYADVKAGYSFKRAAQIDEYVVLIPDRETKVRVAAENDQQLVDGNSVVMVPPGRSEVEVLAGGVIVILATTRSADLVARCANAASYAAPDPNVADFEAWPPARRPAGFTPTVWMFRLKKDVLAGYSDARPSWSIASSLRGRARWTKCRHITTMISSSIRSCSMANSPTI